METVKNVVASVNQGVANLAQSAQEAMGTVHDKVEGSSLRAACAEPDLACSAVSTVFCGHACMGICLLPQQHPAEQQRCPDRY